MLATVDPRLLDRVGFPLGEQDEGRDPCRGGGGRARRRRPRREPGGVLPRRRRLPGVPRASGPRRARPARSSTRTGNELGRHDGVWRFTPGQRRGIGRRGARAAVRAPDRPSPRTRSSSARTRRSHVRRVEVRGTLHLPRRARRRQAPVPLRAGPGARRADRGRLHAPSRPSRLHGVAPGQVAALYDDDAIVGAGVIVGATG